MDEKTERLRDLFVSATGEEAATESQAPQRGSILEGDGDDEVCAVVEEMREKFEFDTDRSADELCNLVRAFYAGEDDEEIAETMEISPDTVFESRMDLLLVRPDDADTVDSEALSEHLDAGDTIEAAASALDVPVEDARRAVQVRAARERALTTSYRYQFAFEERLTDLDLTDQLTAQAREDGLSEAAEDIETDTEF